MDKIENGVSETRPFTAVFLGLTAEEASEIVNHPKWSAGSWSHALDDRDAARATRDELRASRPKALTDDQIEDVARRHGTGGWQSLNDMKRFARAIIAATEAKCTSTSILSGT
jgi:hypothetical protein